MRIRVLREKRFRRCRRNWASELPTSSAEEPIRGNQQDSDLQPPFILKTKFSLKRRCHDIRWLFIRCSFRKNYGGHQGKIGGGGGEPVGEPGTAEWPPSFQCQYSPLYKSRNLSSPYVAASADQQLGVSGLLDKVTGLNPFVDEGWSWRNRSKKGLLLLWKLARTWGRDWSTNYIN